MQITFSSCVSVYFVACTESIASSSICARFRSHVRDSKVPRKWKHMKPQATNTAFRSFIFFLFLVLFCVCVALANKHHILGFVTHAKFLAPKKKRKMNRETILDYIEKRKSWTVELEYRAMRTATTVNSKR